MVAGHTATAAEDGRAECQNAALDLILRSPLAVVVAEAVVGEGRRIQVAGTSARVIWIGRSVPV